MPFKIRDAPSFRGYILIWQDSLDPVLTIDSHNIGDKKGFVSWYITRRQKTWFHSHAYANLLPCVLLHMAVLETDAKIAAGPKCGEWCLKSHILSPPPMKQLLFVSNSRRFQWCLKCYTSINQAPYECSLSGALCEFSQGGISAQGLVLSP